MSDVANLAGTGQTRTREKRRNELRKIRSRITPGFEWTRDRSGKDDQRARARAREQETHVQGRTSGLSRKHNQIDVSPQPETQVGVAAPGTVRAPYCSSKEPRADKEVGLGLRESQHVAGTRRNRPAEARSSCQRAGEAHRVVAPRAVTGVPARRSSNGALSRDGPRHGIDQRPTERLFENQT